MPRERKRKTWRFTSLIPNVALVVFIYGVPTVLFSLRPPFEQAFFRWLGPNLQVLFAGDWAGVRVILTGFAIAFMILIAIAIHESGHLLAGLAVGFRFRSLHIWR